MFPLNDVAVTAARKIIRSLHVTCSDALASWQASVHPSCVCPCSCLKRKIGQVRMLIDRTKVAIPEILFVGDRLLCILAIECGFC